mgnify:FL=1
MKTILQQLEVENIKLENQIDLLAQFLIENFEEDIGKGKGASEGAIEMVVRLLTELKEQKPAEEGKCKFLKKLDRIQSVLNRISYTTDDEKLRWALVCMLGLYFEHEFSKCEDENHYEPRH